jgi:hypothetical protein
VFTGGLPVLRLAGTVGTGTGRSLAYAVLARVAEAEQPPGTVILELTGAPAAGHLPPAPGGRGTGRTLQEGRRPGRTDAGPAGAGPPDAGPPDAGPPDAGPSEAGTAGAGGPGTRVPGASLPGPGVPGGSLRGTGVPGIPGAGGQDVWDELCMLGTALRPCGIALRLVIAPGREHDRLLETAPGPPGPPVHPTLRAAVLATYAALPGPGLVTPCVRADLAMPAEPLSIGAAGPLFTRRGWGAAREAVGGLGSA